MTYEYDREKKKLKMIFDEDIDVNSCKTLRTIVDGYIMKYSPSVCELNMKNVSFMDSSGLGFVVGRYNLADMIGCKIIVTNTNASINKMLQLYEKTRNIQVVWDVKWSKC